MFTQIRKRLRACWQRVHGYLKRPEAEPDIQFLLDIVFVIDTTASMEPSIAAIREGMKEISQKIRIATTRTSVAFGLVVYRDYADAKWSYLVDSSPLSTEDEIIQSKLNQLVPAGGADLEEAVYDGLYEAITKTQWRPYSTRVIILIGDAPPHKTENRVSLETINAMARQNHCAIHAVGVGTNRTMHISFKEIVNHNRGRYISLRSSETFTAHFIRAILLLLNQTVWEMRQEAAMARQQREEARALHPQIATPYPPGNARPLTNREPHCKLNYGVTYNRARVELLPAPETHSNHAPKTKKKSGKVRLKPKKILEKPPVRIMGQD